PHPPPHRSFPARRLFRSSGNAATRLEGYVTKTGIYASGVLPEVEDLFLRQARELDRKKRGALLHQIQKVVHDHVLHAPIYQLARSEEHTSELQSRGHLVC